MSSGCGDVLSLADLQTAKKHQIFEAEVITGKSGGVAGGDDIDYATNAVTGQTQKTLPAVLRDAGFSPVSWDFSTGGTLTVNDRDKVVYDPVSKTWYSYMGTLPVVVPAAFNPVGNANWKPQTDPNLRDDLGNDSGVAFVSPHVVKAIPDGTLADTQYYVTPEQFGAVGDGVSDDTQAMRDALTAVSAGKIRWLRGLVGSTYLTAQLEIPLGVKKISDLNLIFTTSQGVGLYSQGSGNAHTDLVISDCALNMNSVMRGGILLGNATRCKILRNRIYNFNADGTERYGIRIGTTDTTVINSYNEIDGNTIILPVDPDGGAGVVGLAGIYLVGNNNLNSTTGAVNWDSQYKTIQYTIVTNNTVQNGTHNVQAFGLFNATFSGNLLIGGSHRNINLGTGGERVNITNNRLINAESAAIIFGESRYMHISDNYIQSSATSTYSSDDAAIQFAQSAYNVDIFSNTILGDWKYGMHIFNSRYVSIKGNSITASKAGIAIESSQSSTLPSDALYSTSRSVTQMVTGATTEYDISGNSYTIPGGSACAIYLCQFNNVVLGNISISNETVYSASTAQHIVYLCNANSLATNIRLSNINASGAGGSQYYSTLGRTPFTKITDVSGLEDESIEVTVAAGTPSALLGPALYVASGTVTNFTGGVNGQVLRVRLATGAVLAHNTSLIRLKGDASVTSTTGNSIVTLMRRAGIWFETARSF